MYCKIKNNFLLKFASLTVLFLDMCAFTLTCTNLQPAFIYYVYKMYTLCCSL